MGRGRSMSDQPASCPLCGAILRQSRNLRRHLELLHFGLGGGNGKPAGGGLQVRQHRRTDRSNDFVRSSLTSIRPHGARSDFSQHTRSSQHSEFSAMPALSAISSSVSAASLAGNLAGPGSSILAGGEQTGHAGSSSIVGPSGSSCAPAMLPNSGTGFYSSDGNASMLGCLLPALPSLPSLSAPHDVFRHSDMLRAGIASYHDSSRLHAKHMQRADVA